MFPASIVLPNIDFFVLQFDQIHLTKSNWKAAHQPPMIRFVNKLLTLHYGLVPCTQHCKMSQEIVRTSLVDLIMRRRDAT